MSQSHQQRGVEVTVVAQHHQQRSQGAVDQLDVRLAVFCHELGGGEGGRGGERDRVTVRVVENTTHITFDRAACKLIRYYKYAYNNYDRMNKYMYKIMYKN